MDGWVILWEEKEPRLDIPKQTWSQVFMFVSDLSLFFLTVGRWWDLESNLPLGTCRYLAIYQKDRFVLRLQIINEVHILRGTTEFK